MSSFKEIGLKEEIVAAVSDLGFEKPTPIQESAIPHLLESDQDLIASAQTGTGKTAAFGLPVIHHTDLSNLQTQTIILSPTRELCLQIHKDIESYAKKIEGFIALAVYGGSSIEKQIKALNKGVHLVVATPGRAVDLINRKKLKLNNVTRVVLDEADEMLTMGFKDDLEAILDQTPAEKQVILFSATMSKRIKDITKKYMTNAKDISVARVNTGAENVEHHFYMVHAKNRYLVLKRVLDLNPDVYGIVFCRTRMDTKKVAKSLMEDGYNADALHGDLSQAQRDEVMDAFRSKHLQILVATDVASRGLDVDDLTHVINFNLPDDVEAYVHRSGRTGRAGKSGVSIAIINTREKRKVKEIEKTSSIDFEQKQVPSGEEICTRQLYAMIDKMQDVEVDEEQIAPFLDVIYKKFEDVDRETLIKRFISIEFNRFLDYYKDADDLNVNSRGQQERKSADEVDFARMFVNVGFKNKLTPPRLIGLINQALDSSAAKIGKIDIMGNFTFFDIDKNVTSDLVKGVKGIVFEGEPVKMEVSKSKPGPRYKPDFKGRSKGKKKHKKKFKGKKRF
jgi:ATP-dependent RNA helicase DeaD